MMNIDDIYNIFNQIRQITYIKFPKKYQLQ